LVVSAANVFYTGDATTVRLPAADISTVTAVSAFHDMLVSDLRTETAYVMLDGAGIEPRGTVLPSGTTITQLAALDATGAISATRIALSTPITFNVGMGGGVYSGYGRIILYVGTGGPVGPWV